MYEQYRGKHWEEWVYGDLRRCGKNLFIVKEDGTAYDIRPETLQSRIGIDDCGSPIYDWVD